MTLEYRIGDVVERLAEIPDGSIDLVVSSPPFLALRSYLPADHPDKHKEIGSEPTPAAFIDTLLGLSAEFDRVLAPHGSICIELGDTFSGSGGAGGDYNSGGLRDGQEAFKGSASRTRKRNDGGQYGHHPQGGTKHNHDERPISGGTGWPLAKSLTGIPTLYTWSLAYGRNLLTGEPSPAGQWRIRNVIVWARPNPPVGALGDKFRPATSYITVACKGAKRYFDLDAVRGPLSDRKPDTSDPRLEPNKQRNGTSFNTLGAYDPLQSGGAPPLDWHADEHPEDGDWLWKLSTQPYAGSHYATFPMALPKRMIEAMCPQRVCTVCGKPSTRVVEPDADVRLANRERTGFAARDGREDGPVVGGFVASVPTTTGWTDCGHDNYRTGIVLDPFAGSGTTLEAAQAVGRHAIGIDLDQRNATLARERVGMFMEVKDYAGTETDTTSATLLEVRNEGGR